MAVSFVAALGVLLGACGSASTQPLKPGAILSVDELSHTVRLYLAGGATSAADGFNFDGYANGKLVVSVPVGWTVIVECKNDSTVITHSCAVVPDTPISPTVGQRSNDLAFAGATTPDPVEGLPCGKSAGFSFVASKVGRYRIACLVIGHEADGMWDWLTITAGGAPKVTV